MNQTAKLVAISLLTIAIHIIIYTSGRIDPPTPDHQVMGQQRQGGETCACSSNKTAQGTASTTTPAVESPTIPVESTATTSGTKPKTSSSRQSQAWLLAPHLKNPESFNISMTSKIMRSKDMLAERQKQFNSVCKVNKIDAGSVKKQKAEFKKTAAEKAITGCNTTAGNATSLVGIADTKVSLDLSDTASYDFSFQFHGPEGSPVGPAIQSTGQKIVPLPHCDSKNWPSLAPDMGPFASEGYHFVQFLYDVMFLQHGWIPVPVAGTALGCIRHGGATPGDDDLDLFVYPPAKYLNLTAGLSNADSFRYVFDDFDRIVEEYRKDHPNFHWFRDRSVHTEGPDSKMFAKIVKPGCHFRDYHKPRCIDMQHRYCGAHYITRNMTEMRQLWFLNGGCMPNHVFLCIQPTPYLHETHGAVQMFTGHAKRSTNGLCVCKYGPTNLVCPGGLEGFMELWYGKSWCVPFGAVTHHSQNKIKTFND